VSSRKDHKVILCGNTRVKGSKNKGKIGRQSVECKIVGQHHTTWIHVSYSVLETFAVGEPLEEAH
jgi:hypothetical protein